MSPMVMLGYSPFTVGLCSEQKTKNADLEEETSTGLSYNMSNEEKQLRKSPTVCVREGVTGSHLRGAFGSIGVLLLLLPLPHAFRWDVVLHLPIVAVLIHLRLIFKPLLLSRSQSLNTHTHVIANKSHNNHR